MVMQDITLETKKHAPASWAILMAMQIWRYEAKRIA